MSYGIETKELIIAAFLLYRIPEPVINPAYPLLISTNFTMLTEVWFPTRSTFKFFENEYDRTETFKVYGTIMFGEFVLGAKESENCQAACRYRKYTLEVAYLNSANYAVYSIQDEAIVTDIKRFYKWIKIFHREHTVLSGVSFMDHEGQILKSLKQYLSFENQ